MDPKHEQGDSWKVTAIIKQQMLMPGGGEAAVLEKWSDSVRILKEQPAGFAGTLCGFCKKEDAKLFDLTTWTPGVAIDPPAFLAGFL